MGKISSYPLDNNVTGNDTWIASDGDNGNITKTISAGALAAYMLDSGQLDGVDKNFVHTQSTSSDSWTINHNLNKKPSVVIIDSAGSIVHGQVTYTDDNSITLTFSAAFSGVAYLN